MYDIITIGAGPAGLTAGIYGARGGMKTLIIESNGKSSQATKTNEIANFSSYPFVDGRELVEKMKAHAIGCGADFILDDIISIDLENKCVTTSKMGLLQAKKLILAMGASPLPHPNTLDFKGRGISYCATCDGNFCKNKTVMIIGGGDTALTEALYLSKIAAKVYLVHRRDKFRGAEALSQLVRQKENIEILFNTQLEKVLGEDKLSGVILSTEGVQRQVDIFKLFVAVGVKANSQSVSEQLQNERGFIAVDTNMESSVRGVFAVGDIRITPLRQVITACADGAIAANKAIADILDNK